MFFENNELVNEIDRALIISGRALDELDVLLDGISRKDKLESIEDIAEVEEYLVLQSDIVKSALVNLENEINHMIEFEVIEIDFPLSDELIPMAETSESIKNFIKIKLSEYTEEVERLKIQVTQLIEALGHTRSTISPGSEYIM